MEKLTVYKVREKLKIFRYFKTEIFKATVIERNGNIVIRLDVGSPRHVDTHAKSLSIFINKSLGVKSVPNSYHGRKGLCSNYWAEAIITEEAS